MLPPIDARRFKDLAAALRSWGQAEIDALEKNGQAEVVGQIITPGDVIIERRPKPGMHVASDGQLTVIVDTTIDDSLLREGLAREFVSLLQHSRKEAGLEVSDRVAVTWSSDDEEVCVALREHETFILREVLAVNFIQVNHNDEGMNVAQINGRNVAWTLTREVDR
jgi:hypothetical protein